MRRAGFYITLLLLVSLLSSIPLACKKSTTSLTTSSTQSANTTTPITTTTSVVQTTTSGSIQTTATSGVQTTSSTRTSTTSSVQTTTTGSAQTSQTSSTVITSTSVPVSIGMPDIADMKSLASYRLSIMTKLVKGTGAGLVTYMKYEYVKDQKAEHAWMEDTIGKVTETYIKIGDKYWIWLGIAGMNWVEQPPQTTTTTAAIPSDLASQIKQLQQDAENAKVRFDKKGTETVNNVRCIRYEFEYSMTTNMPNLATGGTIKTDTHSSGNIWIADQSGLPAVMIKTKNTAEITVAGETTVMEAEQNLTDIGAAITIKPPEGAMQIPTGIPTFPTGIPTIPSGGAG
jgi:hypothetical protein